MRKIIVIMAGVSAYVPVCVFGAAPVKLWEKTIGSQYNFRPMDGATIADLDRDGKEEVLAASTDGKLYVWRCDGADYPGFPKQVHKGSIWFQSTPAVGDIDGDGDAEVVIGARGTSTDGALYAWHHNGTTVNGFPKDGWYVTGTVALEDLDDDGAYEIIAGERNWPVGKVHIYDGAGTAFPGWPKNLYGVPYGETAVGDIDDDGKPEILLSSKTEEGKYALFAWNADGSPVRGFPYEFREPYNEHMSDAAPALADWNNDGRLEIAFGTAAPYTYQSYFYLLQGDGTTVPGWPKPVKAVRGAASAADVDNDGYLEVIARDYRAGNLYIWNYDGTSVPGFPVSGMDGGGNAALADIDGDRRFEIISDDYYYRIVAFNHDGSPCEGFPVATKGCLWFNSVAVWDIDRDGALELVTVSSGDTNAYVTVYRVGGDVNSPVWPMHNHDRRHTSCYDTDLGIGIKLDYFCARAEGEAVLVRWATAGEWNHAGFNLYREAAGASDEGRVKVNEALIVGRSPYRFVDDGVKAGQSYKYYLEDVDLSGKGTLHGPVRVDMRGRAKASFALAQNAPNPARTTTTFAFSVPAACEARITVYDIAGRKVMTAFAGGAKAGENELSVDVSTLAPGVYTYRLEAGGEAAAKRMVVVK